MLFGYVFKSIDIIWGSEFTPLQSDWANNDNDWQLKKLQHDSLKTAEKVVEVLRETIEREVLTLGKDYERLFGSRSAQFAEYLTMVAQKLEQHGVQHSDVINWLNSAAREGSVPSDYASDLRDSQSKTVPFIPGGPMQELVEQNLFDRSLGTQGVASPRPGMATVQAANIDFSQTVAHGNGGNGHFANRSQSQLPAQTASVPTHNHAHTPAHTPLSMPLPAMPQPVSHSGNMPMPQNVHTFGHNQGAGVPLPPAPPHGQPNFSQPSFTQPTNQNLSGQQTAIPQMQNMPQSQPQQQQQQQHSASQQNQFSQAAQGAAPLMRREDKKDEDNKYVFDPFTAWD